MRIQRWFSGGLRRYSSCGSPLVPPVAMGERWPPYPTGGRKTRKLEKRAHAEKGAWGTRREKRKRGSRGAFLRDVAFAGHHAYVTLREGHVRAYNTIRGVIPPSPPLSLSLGHLFNFNFTVAIVPVVVNFVPSSAVFRSAIPPFCVAECTFFLKCRYVHARSIYYGICKALLFKNLEKYVPSLCNFRAYSLGFFFYTF